MRQGSPQKPNSFGYIAVLCILFVDCWFGPHHHGGQSLKVLETLGTFLQASQIHISTKEKKGGAIGLESVLHFLPTSLRDPH
jgi:hypothetical protein